MIICIDPGHGGTDPGAVGCGLRESDIALTISQRIAQKCADIGIENIMTRVDDSHVSLADRCAMANNVNADLFVSVHINCNGGTPATGIETESYSLTGNSYNFAVCVQNNMISATGAVNRGVKERSGLYVLRGTHMPAILCECGFINNPDDAAKLNTVEYQETIASAILNGICEYSGIANVPEPAAEPLPESVDEPIPGYGADPAALIYAMSANSTERDKVIALQIALTLDGSPVTVDGVLGSNTAAALKNHSLRRGSSGHLVVWVQRLLGAEPDAVYGGVTMNTVAAWQHAESLSADGIVGIKSYRALALDSE